MSINEMSNRYYAALNKLCKWRTVFAGWQLGTRTKEDPESQAVRDAREALIILRMEVTTMMKILTDKGIITDAEYFRVAMHEIEALERMYEKRFPGFKSTDNGMVMDIEKAKETMKGWRP